MKRFLIEPELLKLGPGRLTGGQAHHASRVLRLKPGEKVTLLDGEGHEAEADITAIGRNKVDFEITGWRAPLPEPETDLVLGLGLLKADRMDLIVQKGTELGWGALIPVITERTSYRPNGQQAEKMVNRWRKIALESLKQCRRSYPMRIERPAGFEEFLTGSAENDLKLMLYEDAADKPDDKWKDVLAQNSRPETIRVLVGPEGGFSQTEAGSAREAGFRIMGLGRRTLRSETAALALMSIIGFWMGDLSDFD